MTTQQTIPGVKELINGIITPDGFEREETTDSSGFGEFAQTFPVLRLTRPGVTPTKPDTTIEIHFVDEGPDGYYLGTGHVTFDTTMGTRTFDRYGVEDSFYIANPGKWGANRQLWTGDRVTRPADGARGTVIDVGYAAGKKVRPTEIHWDDGTLDTYTDRRLKTHKITHSDVIDQANHTIRKMIEEKIPAVRDRLAQSERVPGLPFTVTPETKAQITKTLKSGGRHCFTPSGFGTGYTLTTKRSRWSTAKPELAQFFGVRSVWVETFDAD